MNEKMNYKLDDDMLEGVAGGAGRSSHSDSELAKAGVVVGYSNGKKTYKTTLSNGKTINLSENVALGMCDCYVLSGGTRLSDQQVKDLIAQS